jgi:hypothetical protein
VIAAAAGAALVMMSMGAASASATFHFMKIREISPGTGADDSYVEIQMYTPLQNFLSGGATLVRCDATCSSPASFTSFSNVANGNSQDTVLFGDSGIGTASKDFDVNLNLESVGAAGALCYLSEPGYNDCVSWGTFSGNAALMSNYGTSAGTPAEALTSGMALRRSIAAGCPTLLEAGDDTNDSASDFSQVAPAPRKNSDTPTEVSCGGTGPGGYPPSGTPPSSPAPKKKKCKKAKKRAAAAKKKCRKRKK